MTCPHLDVRRPQGRGAKLGVKPKTLPLHPGATGKGKIGRVCDARSHVLSERVYWRVDRDRRRSSGPVLVARPRSDVRRRRSRRGAKHQAKAQGRPSHPGATGERQSGRVKDLNLRPMSRYGQLRGWVAGAEHRDWPLRSGRRRPGSPPGREEHRRPRGTGGTHPARSSCARNAVTPVTPVEVRAVMPGQPTVRKAQQRGGNLMIKKRTPVAETQQEPGT